MIWRKGWLLVMFIVLTIGNFAMFLALQNLHRALQDYYEEYIKPTEGESDDTIERD